MHKIRSVQKAKHYLERYVSHGFGQVIGLQAVPVVKMFSHKHRHLQRNCGTTAAFKDFPLVTDKQLPLSAQKTSLTGQHCGHQGSKHEEKHREEEEASVVENLAGIISNFEIEQANEYSNGQMGHHPKVGQHLEKKKK